MIGLMPRSRPGLGRPAATSWSRGSAAYRLRAYLAGGPRSEQHISGPHVLTLVDPVGTVVRLFLIRAWEDVYVGSSPSISRSTERICSTPS